MTTDKKAVFDDAYRRYYEKCLLFARSYTHDLSLSEDIVVESMIVLWRKLQESGGLDEEEQVLPFLVGVVRNKILQHFRKEMSRRKAHSQMEEASSRELSLRFSMLEECDPSALYAVDVRSILDESLASMKDKTREVFVLSRMKNMTNEEISATLGISVKGVEYHITKALKKLREDLRDYYCFLVFFI